MSSVQKERENTLLEMRGIVKKFPGVQALKGVDFTIDRGEIVALVGENGAGKSTLMKVLTGVHQMDSGEILIDGESVTMPTTLAAIQTGISMIYQELNLLPNLSIAENIFLGREPKKSVLLDRTVLHEEAEKFVHNVGLKIDTKTLVGDLSTAHRQMIEVAKALSLDARLIIMDEPTSSLTDSETKTLFEIIADLKRRDVAVIFISHRMKEIFEVADRIAVMRDGEMVTSLGVEKTTTAEVIQNMVGREIDDVFAKEEAEITDIALEVENLSTKDFLRDISFHVRKGEILGFAGLVGSGRSEVLRAVFGIDKRETGTIRVDGEEVTIRNTGDALSHKIGFLPEDRKEQALVLPMTVRENITLACLDALSRFRFLKKREERQTSEEYVERLKVRAYSIEQIVENLSGGNQQKVVIGKWLATNSKVLILDEPTRGIDVGSKKEIHSLMSKLAREGVAIIMISSELPEILGMSDRIVVMHEGRITGELSRDEANQESIVELAIS